MCRAGLIKLSQPLGSILNLQKLLLTPHTPEQISALWTAYHASRSGGTGRGYVCAAIPLETYEKMAFIATKYPTFVFPLPRGPPVPVASSSPEAAAEPNAHEFFFMQWAFHGPPPEPSSKEPDLFSKPPSPEASSLPPTSTVLFAPLIEYKMRASFATPYFVLTHYTDLAKSHGLVLLRGEITPGKGGGDSWLLTQEEAQILALGVQKFYLWSGESEESAGELLRVFHEKPEEFEWEKLLKHTLLQA